MQIRPVEPGRGRPWDVLDPTMKTLSLVDLHAGLLHRRSSDTVETYSMGAPLSAALPTPQEMLVVQGGYVRLVTDLTRRAALG